MLTYRLGISFYSKCYGKSLKSLGQGNPITGYVFLDHPEHWEDSRLDRRMEAGNSLEDIRWLSREIIGNEHEIHWVLELTEDGNKMEDLNEGEGGILSNWAAAKTTLQQAGVWGPGW